LVLDRGKEGRKDKCLCSTGRGGKKEKKREKIKDMKLINKGLGRGDTKEQWK
jgi:hypothetical protein